MFTSLTENFIDKFPAAHALVCFNIQFRCYLSDTFFVHLSDIESGEVLNSFIHAEAFPGALKIDSMITYL